MCIRDRAYLHGVSIGTSDPVDIDPLMKDSVPHIPETPDEYAMVRDQDQTIKYSPVNGVSRALILG